MLLDLSTGPANLQPPFLPIRFIQATVSCLCVNVCVCGADWKIEIKFGWQAGSSTLSAYATPHYRSVLCPATQDFLTSLTSLSLSRLSHPDLSSSPPPISLLSSQAKSCICHMCGAHLNRLHSCLYCVFFGCFTKKHIHEHAKNKRHNLGKTRGEIHPDISMYITPPTTHPILSIHMQPRGPLQHQLLSVRDYSITLGNFLL